MRQDSDTRWPERDPELTARMEGASDAELHAWMCDCAEHALAVCEPLCADAGFSAPPDTTPIKVKRRWLEGLATEEELQDAQKAGVWECYWGKSIELGAALLGTAWYPGSGLTLPEDEEYAERMTYYPGALAAALDVMHECVNAVRSFVYGALWKRENSEPASKVVQQAIDSEQTWQRRHILLQE